MRRNLEEYKLTSNLVELKEIETTRGNGKLHYIDLYRFNLVLSDDYWQWNLTSPYVSISEKIQEIDNSEIESKNDNFSEPKISFYNLKDNAQGEKKKPSFATQFADWTIDKGDYILPPPEIRFKKSKKAIMRKLKRELLNLSVLLPIILFIVLYILNTFFEE
jgi:hypothetical protein